MDAHFLSLGLSSMEPVDSDSKEFKALQAYARDTHGVTHAFQAHVQHAFRVERFDLVSYFYFQLQNFS
jgi:poly [ADP-ribose] polymerase 2/3/4